MSQEEEQQAITRKIPRKSQHSEKFRKKPDKQKILMKNQKTNIKKMNTTKKYPPPRVFNKIFTKVPTKASKKQQEAEMTSGPTAARRFLRPPQTGRLEDGSRGIQTSISL